MLRKPFGELPVGIRKYDTREIGKTERRKVPLTVFYPSGSREKEYPYMDPAWQKAAPDSPDNGVHTFCGDAPELSGQKETFPVILFSHGLCGYEMENTVLCADLASFGYVVVSVGHPRGGKIVTYSDGRVFEDPDPFSKLKHHLDKLEPVWYEDFVEALEYLKGMNRNDPMWKDRLDLLHVGIVGDSFGGCCGIAAALKNEEFRYAVNLDGGLFVPMTYSYTETPILILCSSWNIKAYAGLSRHGCINVEIKKYRKMVHYEFSDGVYLGPKGKNNRSWADEVSRERTERVLEFIRKW